MFEKVIVILFICSKLDYTASLPDIIRIGDFPHTKQQQKYYLREKILFHATQGAPKGTNLFSALSISRDVRHGGIIFNIVNFPIDSNCYLNLQSIVVTKMLSNQILFCFLTSFSIA